METNISNEKYLPYLHVGLVLDQLLGAAVQKTDMGIGADHVLSVQLQHHPETMMGFKFWFSD